MTDAHGTRQLVLRLSEPPAPTLENFAPGDNREVLAVLHAWLSGALKERCVYLWGPPGCGKSHLLRAALRAPRLSRGAVLCSVSSELDELERSAVLPGLVVLDDVQRFSTDAQAALFRLFQRLHEDDVRLLGAGDAAPAALDVRSDVATRLGSGLVFKLRLLSDEEKAEALHAYASGRGFALSPELTDYLLQHGRRDLPALMAVLDALDQYSLQTKRPVTLPLLREVLQLR